MNDAARPRRLPANARPTHRLPSVGKTGRPVIMLATHQPMETLPGQHHPRIEDEHDADDKGLELTGHGPQRPGLRRTPKYNLVAIMRSRFRNVNDFPRGSSQNSSNRRLAALTQVGIITAEIGLGLRYIALVHIIGHACLRTLQLLRAPTLLQDYHLLENAISPRQINWRSRPGANSRCFRGPRFQGWIGGRLLPRRTRCSRSG